MRDLGRDWPASNKSSLTSLCRANDHSLHGWPETGFEEIGVTESLVLEADFWPASKSAIKCRIRPAATQAEPAIAIATSLHR